MICIIELEYFRYISFCDEQDTVKKFRHEVLRTQSVVPLGCTLNPPVNDGLTRATIRRRVWNIIDNNEPSILAKVYVLYFHIYLLLTLKAPPLICSKRQLKILPLFQK